ncbi:Thioredoxin reductase [Frigoribacterium sp. JB110]|nr:Thioredoxin reductase [Frigoribacterium sp. JB110]
MRTVLDLGSGTGAGTVALARRFPHAQVHGLDLSTELLDRLTGAAAAAGVADRVHAHQVDLDEDWTNVVPSGVDVVWASLSLHHVADPLQVLRRALSVLRPGGVLVATEMRGSIALTPDDLGTGREGLADRVAEGLAALGYPSTADWTVPLAEAGFAPTQLELADLTVAGDSAEGAAYVATQISAWRNSLARWMSSEDLVALEAAKHEVSAGSSPVTATSGRAVWVAVRPDVDTSTVNAPATGSASTSVDAEPETLEAEVVVVGGGAAGLAAAIAMGRSRRNVVVIDVGEPRNAPADGIHNALGNEGISPLELLAKGRVEAESVGVRIVQGAATAAHGTIDDFTIDVDAGKLSVHARRVVLATGLIDVLPEVPGVREAWGHTVLHCPFCHGWEVRDQRIAILTRDDIAVHHAMLFRQLSESVTLFLHEAANPTPEQQAQLDALGVAVIRPRVERLHVDGTEVRSIEVDGGDSYDVDAVVIAPRFNARTELYEALGGEATITPFGQQIAADARGATAVPGVFTAGNASEPMAMLVASTASGVMTGSAAHGDLAFADLNRAVQAHHAEGLSA